MEFAEHVELAAEAIPLDVFVPCPKDGFAQIGVRNHCVGCAFNGGFLKVGDRVEGRESHFANLYRVRCGHPIDRRMTVVKI